MRAHRGRGGFAMVVVLFFAVLLVSLVTVFVRRATIDAMIVRNREAGAQAEALARGGVQIASALILQDALDEIRGDAPPLETGRDLWARAGELEIPGAEGMLRIRIQDAGARFNPNALFEGGKPLDEASEALLEALLDKVVEEMPGRPEEKLYDPGELARNWIDWVDEDDVRVRGGDEDAWYQDQDPPYRAANRPLLSVDELALVEGFDPALVEALRPYLAVFPLAGAGGVNPNTAPPWVLATLYLGTGGEFRVAGEPVVRDVLRIRERQELLCPESIDVAGCRFAEGELQGTLYPEPAWASDVFYVTSEARHGDVRRRIEAVLDRSETRPVRVLAWRVH